MHWIRLRHKSQQCASLCWPGQCLPGDGDLRKARNDFRRSRELDPDDIDIKFLLEWSGMCIEGPDPETPARLITMAAVNPHLYAAYVCRGVALVLRERFEEALIELDRAILLDPRKGEAPFWNCLLVDRPFYHGEPPCLLLYSLTIMPEYMLEDVRHCLFAPREWA